MDTERIKKEEAIVHSNTENREKVVDDSDTDTDEIVISEQRQEHGKEQCDPPRESDVQPSIVDLVSTEKKDDEIVEHEQTRASNNNNVGDDDMLEKSNSSPSSIPETPHLDQGNGYKITQE
ncbi:hypothetical protein TSUD_294510 [Trifolium subterraneum]|uniref:Uncharacterized protein n=1 Tax=Trifolium subterraneum TaxID=3900 RepID=A0A2Z6MMM2_TRISU|nr:hypothetical protein TSUD_294510 [Trifolium subterraneum]